VCPHGTQLNQFAIFVRAGMRPLAAIRTATSVDAALLGVADRGTLEAGKLADVVAVPGDPSRDIAVMERLFFVMKGGTVVRNDRAGSASAADGLSGAGN
jgi:imidazolonepropionase-like amidohydrolase